MDAPQPRENWVDLQIEKMVGFALMHPIVTRQLRIGFESAELRVEQNLIQNVATFAEDSALRIELPNESEYVAVIVPILNDGRLLLVARYRYAVDRWSVEFPRTNCQLVESGWREPAEEMLLKDTGHRADNLKLLGAVQVDPALMSVNSLVILAENCMRSQERGWNAAELIAGSIALTPDELDDLMQHGQVVCGVTLAALCLYRASLRGK